MFMCLRAKSAHSWSFLYFQLFRMTPSKVWQALKEESSVLFAAMTIRVRSQAVWLPGFIYPQITEI